MLDLIEARPVDKALCISLRARPVSTPEPVIRYPGPNFHNFATPLVWLDPYDRGFIGHYGLVLPSLRMTAGIGLIGTGLWMEFSFSPDGCIIRTDRDGSCLDSQDDSLRRTKGFEAKNSILDY